MGNNQAANQPSTSANCGEKVPKCGPSKGKQFSFLGILVLLLSIGHVRGANSDLADYYNNFAKETYNESVIENWGRFVKVVSDPKATFQDLSIHLNKDTIPVIAEAVRKAELIDVPYFVKDYHSNFQKDVVALRGTIMDLKNALDKEDQAEAETKMDIVVTSTKNMESSITALRDKLIAEKNLEPVTK